MNSIHLEILAGSLSYKFVTICTKKCEKIHLYIVKRVGSRGQPIGEKDISSGPMSEEG